jgi:hypothetical protein
MGIAHPDELQHAVGKVKPTVGCALTGVGVARPFLKSLFQQAISHLSFRCHQYKNVV